MDDSDDSDFYGSPKTISKLKSRVATYNTASYFASQPSRTKLITSRITPSPSSSSPPPSGRLHNPYSSIPHSAYQLTESIPQFLTRLPPSTTTGPEWIFIANPYLPPKPPPSTSRFLTGGLSRLALFSSFITGTTSAHPNSPLVAKRHIAVARKETIADLKQLAVEHRNISGKWMLFPEVAFVNETWERVAKAVANNQLGTAAKVATKLPPGFDDGHSEKNTRLICIYTEDFTNKDDVARVLKRMKELDLVKQGPGARLIYYKADAWTELGIYGENEWGIKASMYNSKEIFEYIKEEAEKKTF
ncbi:hypothetical protein QBC40DRAFT_319873 [Triangularia verruculosa]|uniref:DUF1917-domain-containing protein n=1 Tax=Triangularia verruculosa TaxID=2587418 RepID=A0AAN7AQ53_9PEZI|nr:hypothetical protein QBC40DRAFT_319873 [Triangularia verruculosa]